MKAPNRTKSITSAVREILLRRPFLLNAIKLGVVNYSALARYMQNEIKANVEAIKTAILRERSKLIATVAITEKDVLNLLKRTKITLRDKVAIIISRRELGIPYLVRATLAESYVYLVDQTKVNLDEIRGVSISKNMVALILTSPGKVENIPGFVAFITQLLASRGINIREFISCYTDTIIVLRSEDAIKAFMLLQEFM
jgi:predicted amino acid-binding ACT domain protein